jgi:TonB-linked SusC/RagA family outer membrane protein
MKIFDCDGICHRKEKTRMLSWLSGLDAAIKWKLIMRINFIAFFLLFTIMHVSASVHAQKITLSIEKGTLKSIFKEIEQQSGFEVWYNNNILKGTKPVSLKISGDLKMVLDKIFSDQPLTYEIVDKTIVIKRKPVSVVEKITKFQKAIKITGTVTDENGTPLSGVTVKVKGNNATTTTDREGKYNIEVPDEDSVLQFSYIGFETEEISINENVNINVSLRVAIGQLDQIQVIGYGTTTQRKNTGSIISIKGSAIEKQPVSNPLASLEGLVPGMFVTQSNGLPGSNFNVQIRGRNSIQQGSNPLYLVDGIPFGSDDLAQNSLISASSPFNNLSTSDIESIEILKDADATAIYGSRGANGVVLITTKKAKSGKMTLEATLYQGVGKVTRTLDMMNSDDYVAMRFEAFKNDNVEPTTQNAYDLLAWDTGRFTDWKQILIGGTAHATNAQVRLNAGSEFTRISLGTNYYRESTVFPGDHASNRITAFLKGGHTSLNRKFNVDVSVNYASEKSNLMRQSLTNYINLSPNAPQLYNENGKLNWAENGFSFSNPMGQLLEEYNGITDRLTTQSDISYILLPGLRVKGSLGYNTMKYDEKTLLPLAAQNPDNDPVGSAAIGISTNKTLIAEPQIEYTSSFSKSHEIKILIGATWQTSKNTKILTRASGFTNDDFLNYISASTAPVINTINGFNQYNYQAVFARLGYSYEDRYLINFTGRRDGSSRFGNNRQFANFGAIGAAWLFSNEPLIKQIAPVISYGKIRGSYGVTGNDQIGNYQYLDSWAPTDRPYLNNLSLTPARLANPYYSWEGNKKLDVALELGFFQDRLLITADWYRNTSNNQLIYYSLPTQTGFYNILKNFPGKVENKGWELQLNTVNIKSAQFNWSSSLNITIARNKLIEFPGLETSSYANTYVIGEALSMTKGYKYLGIDAETGIYQFDDKNKDGQLNSEDYYPIETTDPKYYGGFLNTLNYKGFQLDFLVQFTKQRGRHPIYASSITPGGIANFSGLVADRWQSQGDDAAYQKYTQQAGGEASNAAFLMSNSDRAFTDASFIRLRNASLSYTFSNSLVQKFNCQKLRVFVQGQNLFTVTDFPGDPETQSQLALPPLRMITTGFQIIF